MTLPTDKFFRAVITWRTDFSADLWAIRVDPRVEFSFVPGQYATLGVETDRGLLERPYSIVSAPHEPEAEFFLELVPQGRLTPRLHGMQVGEELSFRRTPKGRFTLDTGGSRTSHLLLCTVTGVAPFVSYVRTLHRRWTEGTFGGEHKLFLIQGASRPSELGYRDELQRTAEAVPWFVYVPTISRPWDHPEWNGERGRVEDVLRKYSDRWALGGNNTIAYLCGHPGMIAQTQAILHRRGWTKDALREEAFFTMGTGVPDRDADEGTA